MRWRIGRIAHNRWSPAETGMTGERDALVDALDGDRDRDEPER
jgi:hypothetical protein